MDFRETHECHTKGLTYLRIISVLEGSGKSWNLSQGLKVSDTAHKTSRRAFQQEAMAQAKALGGWHWKAQHVIRESAGPRQMGVQWKDNQKGHWWL